MEASSRELLEILEEIEQKKYKKSIFFFTDQYFIDDTHIDFIIFQNKHRICSSLVNEPIQLNIKRLNSPIYCVRRKDNGKILYLMDTNKKYKIANGVCNVKCLCLKVNIANNEPELYCKHILNFIEFEN